MNIDREAVGRVTRVYEWFAIVATILVAITCFFIALRSPDSIWHPLAVGLLIAGSLGLPFQRNPEKYRSVLKTVFFGVIAISLVFVALRWLDT